MQNISLEIPKFQATTNQEILNFSSSTSLIPKNIQQKFLQKIQNKPEDNFFCSRLDFLEEELKKTIIKFRGLEDKVQIKNIVFGFGSYSILERLARKFLPKGTILGESPQFRFFPMEYILAGGNYLGISFDENIAEKILYEIQNNLDLKVIYINNPNNPTGQTRDKNVLQKIISKADQKGITIIIDEIYADLLPIDFTCADLINDFENLIVLKSFSKIWGMNNVRLGYFFASEPIISKYKKICNRNEITNYSALLAQEILLDPDYLNSLRKKYSFNKNLLIKRFQNLGFEVFPTNNLVPLIYIKSPKLRDINLFFQTQNISAEPSFLYQIIDPEIDGNCMRFTVPSDENFIYKLQTRLGK